MKVAVINFSGNVGKTTVARHLLQPRILEAELVTIESINADEGQSQSLRGRHFAELQEYLQIAENVVVDIGASNVEELLASMKRFRGSHADFDYFVVPTVPVLKQQQDTIATLVELGQIGAPADKVRLVFNMVDDAEDPARSFDPVLAFIAQHPVAHADLACRLGANEIYARVKMAGLDLATLLNDQTDSQALIAQTQDQSEKISLARRLATRRLASGVVPELDACFAALCLTPQASAHVQRSKRPPT